MTLTVTSGLFAHYDADSLTGLSDGDPVTSWPDESGNGRTLSGGSPVYKSGILNGLPGVRFDGVDDKLQAAAPLTDPFTAFVVGNTSDASSSQQRAVIGFGSTLVFVSLHYGSDAIRRMYAGSFLDGDTSDTDVHLIRAVFNESASELVVDGVTEGSGNAGDRELFGIDLGVDRGSGSRFHEGDVFEVLIYDRMLTAGEITDVEGYLDTKWFDTAVGPVGPFLRTTGGYLRTPNGILRPA